MSLRSPRNQGFTALPNANMNDDIPLTNVQTRSSSTGARKPGDEIYSTTSFQNQPTFRDDEKKGLFKRNMVGGRRKVKKINSKPNRVGTDGEEVNVNGLGRFYNKVVNFSVV